MDRLAHIIQKKGSDFLQNVHTVVFDHFDIIRRDYHRKRQKTKEFMHQILDAMPDKVLYHSIWSTTTYLYGKTLDPSDRKRNWDYKNHKQIKDLNGAHGFGAEFVRANKALLFQPYINHSKISVRVPVEKFAKLGGLLLTLNDSKTIIFVNSNDMVMELEERLNKVREESNLEFPALRKYGAGVMSQSERESVRELMKEDDSCIVVATDLGSQTHYGFQNVIQYDISHKSRDERFNMDDFLKRMGRLLKDPADHSDEERNHYCFIERQPNKRAAEGTEDELLLQQLEKDFDVKFMEKNPRKIPLH